MRSASPIRRFQAAATAVCGVVIEQAVPEKALRSSPGEAHTFQGVSGRQHAPRRSSSRLAPQLLCLITQVGPAAATSL